MLSKTGFVTIHAGTPVFWRSKLNTEIASSTCEAEHIALSTSMKEVIPIMQLLKYLKVSRDVITTHPIVTCNIFEDNQRCIIVVESNKLPTRTKKLFFKCHHDNY